MKLGTETGSLTNHLLSAPSSLVPTVGTPATLLSWTDRYPGTVVEINGPILTVQKDTAVRTDGNGMSESQSYDYSPNPNGGLAHFKKNKAGRWTQVVMNPETRRWRQFDGYGLRLGSREKYHDFSF